jgi:hypothetical protein
MIFGHYLAIAQQLEGLMAPEGAEHPTLGPYALRDVQIWTDQTASDDWNHALPVAFVEFLDLPMQSLGDGTSVGPAQLIIHLLLDLAEAEGIMSPEFTSEPDHPVHAADRLCHAVHAAMQRFSAVIPRTPGQLDTATPYADSQLSALSLVSVQPTTPYPGMLDLRLRYAATVGFSSALKPSAAGRGQTVRLTAT